MIAPSHVQADVVDIRNPVSMIPADIVVDANVLYWVFYPNFGNLTVAGGSTPRPYQTSAYPRYWSRAAKARARFHTAVPTLGEFAKISEHAELESIWLTDPSQPQPNPAQPATRFDPRLCKFARYHYSTLLASVRTDVEAMIASICKSVELLPPFATSALALACSTTEWLTSCGDSPDALMVATAKCQSVLNILSDDADIATFGGVTLFTANSSAITAAASAGRLK